MFTNWLTVPSPTTTLPPDVVLEVGPPPYTRFAAHSALLSAHSGYLRAVVRNENEDSNRAPDAPIYIPNVTSEQFAPLLTYIYTGFLDLSIDNIFGVLLATHILHMPRALELCRVFLARTQSEGFLGGNALLSTANEAQTAISSKIIRPIPNKPMAPGISFIAAPISNTLLPSRQTRFKSLNLSVERSVTPEPSTSKKVSTEPIAKRQNKKTGLDRSTSENSKKSSQSEPKHSDKEEDKVIIDVASCDGPIRFRRVLNENFGKLGNSESTAVDKRQQSISFHQQMVRNINERKIMSDESENSQDDVNQHNSATGGREVIYNCVYCKHTFKSQYCYQKHAKRHLNPLNIDGESTGGDTTDSSAAEKDMKRLTATAAAAVATIKREVRPLDMNVQYYPCKTCGSKFPSYYFVHKHRKMCHADEEIGSV